jgi:hypothetical protein
LKITHNSKKATERRAGTTSNPTKRLVRPSPNIAMPFIFPAFFPMMNNQADTFRRLFSPCRDGSEERKKIQGKSSENE